MTEEAPPPPPRNIGLWVGLGCLGVLVVSCCMLTFWLQSYGMRFIAGQSDGTKIWLSRVVLVGALEGTRKTCTDGVISEDTLPWFHANMPSAERNLACQLDEPMLRSLSSPERDTAIPLAGSGRAELATGLGMDPAQCFEHSTDEMRAVGCFDFERGTGTIPYQIIHLSLSAR